MIKWILITLTILLYFLTLSFAAQTASAIGNAIMYPVIVFNLIFAILSSFYWLKAYKKIKRSYKLFICFLPIILIILCVSVYKYTQAKINRPYFILAFNPGEHSHQFQYYFRTDGTLKTYGIFFGSDDNVFQNFRMKGDTIFLDEILPFTGIASKKYLITFIKDKQTNLIKALVPLNEDNWPILGAIQFIVKEDYRGLGKEFKLEEH